MTLSASWIVWVSWCRVAYGIREPTRIGFIRERLGIALVIFIHSLTPLISGSSQSQPDASRSRSPQQQFNEENECHSCGKLALCCATANVGQLTAVRAIFLVRAGQIRVARDAPKPESTGRWGVLFLPRWKKCGGKITDRMMGCVALTSPLSSVAATLNGSRPGRSAVGPRPHQRCRAGLTDGFDSSVFTSLRKRVRVKREVAQATRLCRRATRPTELGAASNVRERFSRIRVLALFRPAGRRAGRASRPHYPRLNTYGRGASAPEWRTTLREKGSRNGRHKSCTKVLPGMRCLHPHGKLTGTNE